MGVARSDGLRLLYPGLDHAVVADTGAGKTWFADACTMAEIEAGNRVVYIHYEEGDPASTIERLLLLGADADDVEKLLTFVGPAAPARDEHVQALLEPAPTLAVHDGMNEAMAMNGGMTKEVEGAALFRQRLLVPFLRIGAATLTCDHFPMYHDASRVEAYGTVHKGNAMSGPRFALENIETFGRGLRGGPTCSSPRTAPATCGSTARRPRPEQAVPGIDGDRRRPSSARSVLSSRCTLPAVRRRQATTAQGARDNTSCPKPSTASSPPSRSHRRVPTSGVARLRKQWRASATPIPVKAIDDLLYQRRRDHQIERKGERSKDLPGGAREP